MNKVSIIIPVYNVEHYVAKCIESVISQTYPNLEIIIVDDGSKDSSIEIIRKFQDDRIYIIQQENRGAAAARNVGLKKSTGNLIQFLDADDVLDCNKILNQIIAYTQVTNPQNTLYFGSWKVIKNESIIEPGENQMNIWHDYDIPINLVLDFIYSLSFIPLHCYMVPRQLINQSGLWNENLSRNDDGEFFSRIISNSSCIKFCPQSLSYYRSVPNSLSKRMSSKAANSQIDSVILTSENLLKHPSERTTLGIYKLLTNSLYYLYPYYKDARMKGEQYLRSIMDNPLIDYPILSWKEWVYYYIHSFIR